MRQLSHIDVASQRFALQKKLAELPQFPVTEETAVKLIDSIDRINRSSYNERPFLNALVGPVMESTNRGPVRMQLTAHGSLVEPFRVEDLARLRARDIGQMGRTGLVDAYAPTQQIRNVSFSFTDPDGQPVFGYDRSRDPAIEKQIQAMGGIRKPMVEALYKLIERGGMAPGDLLKATPLGLHPTHVISGDPRRALTYMSQGFGIPDQNTGEMYARIGQGGKLEPVQLYTPNQQITDMLRVKQNASRILQPRQLELDLPTAPSRLRYESFAEADAADFMDEYNRHATYGSNPDDDDGDPGPLQGNYVPERTISNLDELYTPGSVERYRDLPSLDPNVPF